jgi:hypothetical protein
MLSHQFLGVSFFFPLCTFQRTALLLRKKSIVAFFRSPVIRCFLEIRCDILFILFQVYEIVRYEEN